MHSSMIGSAVTYLGIAAIRGGDVSSQVYVLADVSFLPSECTIQHCAQTVKADCARCCMMHADVPDQAALVHSALGMSTGKELKRWTVCDQHAALLIWGLSAVHYDTKPSNAFSSVALLRDQAVTQDSCKYSRSLWCAYIALTSQHEARPHLVPCTRNVYVQGLTGAL